jgi:mono/diheme cytochrome c family protein
MSKRIWLWLVGGFSGAVLAVAVVIWGWSAWLLSRSHPVTSETVRAASDQQHIDNGKRLAVVFGCTHCHGADLRGEVLVDEPMMAVLYASNLTLAAQRMTDAQLAQAIRQGVRIDGRALFVMPSEMYVHLKDDELAAVLGYLRSLPPGGSPTLPVQVGPIGRLGLVMREFLPVPELVATARQKLPLVIDGHAQGRHVALTACSECHGPDLAGLPGSPDLAIAAAYDAEAFRRLMRTGVGRGDRPLKELMSESSRVRFAHFTGEEVAALHAYLKARAEALQRPAPAK